MSRVHVLEIIELRAMNWQVCFKLHHVYKYLCIVYKGIIRVFLQPNENVTAFYKNKLSQLEYQHLDQIPPATPGGMDSPGVCRLKSSLGLYYIIQSILNSTMGRR